MKKTLNRVASFVNSIKYFLKEITILLKPLQEVEEEGTLHK